MTEETKYTIKEERAYFKGKSEAWEEAYRELIKTMTTTSYSADFPIIQGTGEEE